MRMIEAIRQVAVGFIVSGAVAPGVSATQLPDLAITLMAADPPTAEYVDIRFQYKNQGGTDAQFGLNVPPLQLAMDPTSYAFPKNVGQSGSTVRAGGGVGGTIRVYLKQVPATGTYRFTLSADPTNQVAESNETNNRATLTLQLTAPARPDAIIERVVISAEPARPTHFGVQIRNIGQGTAEFRDNARVGTNCTQLQQNVPVTGSIGARQPISISVGLSNPAYFFPTGSHTCKFTLTWPPAYTGGSIDLGQELDATNNAFSYTFVVPEPDLFIDSVTTNPSPVTNSPGSFKTYFFRVRVVNRGSGIHLGTANNAVGRTKYQFIVSAGCAAPIPVSIDLWPGETTTVQLPSLPNVLLPGSYNCDFRVSTKGPESNTSNNVRAFSWTVR